MPGGASVPFSLQLREVEALHPLRNPVGELDPPQFGDEVVLRREGMRARVAQESEGEGSELIPVGGELDEVGAPGVDGAERRPSDSIGIGEDGAEHFPGVGLLPPATPPLPQP